MSRRSHQSRDAGSGALAASLCAGSLPLLNATSLTLSVTPNLQPSLVDSLLLLLPAIPVVLLLLSLLSTVRDS